MGNTERIAQRIAFLEDINNVLSRAGIAPVTNMEEASQALDEVRNFPTVHADAQAIVSTFLAH